MIQFRDSISLAKELIKVAQTSAHPSSKGTTRCTLEIKIVSMKKTFNSHITEPISITSLFIIYHFNYNVRMIQQKHG